MLDVERRVEQRVVLKVVPHRTIRLMFDAVGDARVAGRFGSPGRLESGRRGTNFRDIPIDGVAQPARHDAWHLRRFRGRHLRHDGTRQCTRYH
jgi:hypothetical protein